MSDDSVRTVTIETSDGESLEAELSAPAGATLGVVITHPHPTYGGTMHTPVPGTLFSTCVKLGVAALRFNFRGVGASTGTHDDGRAERRDVAAAVARLLEEVPAGPVLLAGWSFGADVGMAVDDDQLAGWLAVAAPLTVVPPADMAAPASEKPTLLLVPEHDQFRSPDAAAAATAAWRNTTIEVVPGTDHFLAGGLGVVATALERFLKELT